MAMAPFEGITWLEKADSGQVTVQDIGDALEEFARLFKAGIASKAEKLTLARAFPENRQYTEAATGLGDDEPMVVGGPASVSLIDREGHLITTDALKKAFAKFMDNFRTRNAMVLHSDVQVGWALPAYITKGGQIFKSGVDDKGLFFICELRDDTKISEKVMKEINEGRLKSYSIAGSALKVQNMQKGLVPYMQVDDMELAEVTVCEKGVNQQAGFELLKAEMPQTGKIDKDQCDYRDATEEESMRGENCGHCKFFNAEDKTCDTVSGDIQPGDWCKIFAPRTLMVDTAPEPKKVVLVMRHNNKVDFKKSFDMWMSKAETAKDPLQSKESLATLQNFAGREAEHHQLLREYGFPSEQPAESARYNPVIETETDDDGKPIKIRPPWVVNEAGQDLGEKLDEDSPDYHQSAKAKNRKSGDAVQKMGDVFLEKAPKRRPQRPSLARRIGERFRRFREDPAFQRNPDTGRLQSGPTKSRWPTPRSPVPARQRHRPRPESTTRTGSGLPPHLEEIARAEADARRANLRRPTATREQRISRGRQAQDEFRRARTPEAEAPQSSGRAKWWQQFSPASRDEAWEKEKQERNERNHINEAMDVHGTSGPAFREFVANRRGKIADGSLNPSVADGRHEKEYQRLHAKHVAHLESERASNLPGGSKWEADNRARQQALRESERKEQGRADSARRKSPLQRAARAFQRNKGKVAQDTRDILLRRGRTKEEHQQDKTMAGNFVMPGGAAGRTKSWDEHHADFQAHNDEIQRRGHATHGDFLENLQRLGWNQHGGDAIFNVRYGKHVGGKLNDTLHANDFWDGHGKDWDYVINPKYAHLADDIHRQVGEYAAHHAKAPAGNAFVPAGSGNKPMTPQETLPYGGDNAPMGGSEFGSTGGTGGTGRKVSPSRVPTPSPSGPFNPPPKQWGTGKKNPLLPPIEPDYDTGLEHSLKKARILAKMFNLQ